MNRDFLDNIPYSEKFGLAVAAPFRAAVFLDWYTIIFNIRVNGNEFPKHLYTIDSDVNIKKRQFEALRNSLGHDFGIIDETSAMIGIGEMFAGAAIPSETVFPESKTPEDDSFADYARILYGGAFSEYLRFAGRTLVASMTAHAVAASANMGFLTKEKATELLGEIGVYIKSLYYIESPEDDDKGGTANQADWDVFANALLEGEAAFNLSDKKGRKMLTYFVKALRKKPDSPWKNVAFYEVGEQPLSFFDFVDPPVFPEL